MGHNGSHPKKQLVNVLSCRFRTTPFAFFCCFWGGGFSGGSTIVSFSAHIHIYFVTRYLYNFHSIQFTCHGHRSPVGRDREGHVSGRRRESNPPSCTIAGCETGSPDHPATRPPCPMLVVQENSIIWNVDTHGRVAHHRRANKTPRGSRGAGWRWALIGGLHFERAQFAARCLA